MTPDRGLPRLARTLVFAVAALALSGLGHLAGGGGWPRLELFALVGPAMLILSLWLSGRRRRLPGLLGILGLTQGLLHAAYHLAHGGGAVPPRLRSTLGAASHAPGHPGGGLGGPPVPSTAGAVPHLAAGPHDGAAVLTGLLPSPGMLLAHVLAVVLTAWVMARGEQALWRVVHRLKVPLGRVIPAVAPPRRTTFGFADLRPLVSRWAGRVVATRGPPAPGFV